MDKREVGRDRHTPLELSDEKLFDTRAELDLRKLEGLALLDEDDALAPMHYLRSGEGHWDEGRAKRLRDVGRSHLASGKWTQGCSLNESLLNEKLDKVGSMLDSGFPSEASQKSPTRADMALRVEQYIKDQVKQSTTES